MKTRRLTKKYKNKSNRKSIKNRKRKNKSKSRKRILKGGTFEKEKEIFLKVFFSNLYLYKFPEALCALHTFYTCGITRDDINDFLSSHDFKTRYDNMFFRSKQVSDAGGGFHTNIEAKERLIFFLSYIFKKIAEGHFIRCLDGRPIFFIYNSEDNNMLNILQKFFGYLDTACILTISFSIDHNTFDKIRQSKYDRTRLIIDKPPGVTNGQLALYDLYTSLELLAKKIPTMKNDIEEFLALLTTGDAQGSVYSFNTTNMCTLIKMIKELFTYFDKPGPVEPEP